MLQDLDHSLRMLLEKQLSPDYSQVSITFATPDRNFPPQTVSLPAIDFFLYDIRENLELRNQEWAYHRTNGSITKQPPPSRVACSYLITSWYDEGLSDQAQQEHRLLGEVMKVLLRFSTLPAEILQGELASQDLPLPTSLLQSGPLQSIAEFWQALEGKAKAALNYTVTIAVPKGEPISAGPPVLDSQIELQLLTTGGES